MADSEKRDKDIPISTWNNNPGNLKYDPKNNWQGMIGHDPKSKLIIFESPEYGRRALIIDINTKIKNGLNTPHDLINKYAPVGDENPEESVKNYKSYIAKYLGIEGDKSPFPENSAEKIADAITNFEGGTWQDSKEQGKAAHVRDETPRMPTEPPPSNIELDITGKPIDSSQANKDLNESENENRTISGSADQGGGGEGKTSADASDAAKVLLGGAGARTGAAIAGTVEAAKLGIPLIPNTYRALRGTPIDIESPSTRSSMQRYLNSQHHHKVHLSDLEKAFNEHLKLSNPGAEPRRLRTMSEVQEALKAIKKTPDQIIAKPRVEMVPGKPGVFRSTGEVTSRLIPGNPGIDLEKYAPNPKTPVRNAVVSAGKTFVDTGKGFLPPLARVGMGALGGLSAGVNAVDAANYINDPKHGWSDPRTWTKGAAAIGGGLMMIPTPLSQGAGMLLSAPELGYTAYDYFKDK